MPRNDDIIPKAIYNCFAIKENHARCLNKVSKYGDRCEEHKEVELKYFYGFYPEPPVFVNIEDGKQELNNLKLKEFCLTLENDTLEVRIRRDGLVLVSYDPLNKKIQTFRKKSYDEETRYDWRENEEAWEGYLKIFNIINFLLECAQHNVEGNSYYYFQLREITRKDVTRVTVQNNVARKQLWHGNEPVHSFIVRTNIESSISQERGIKERLGVSIKIYEELFKFIEKTDFESDESIYVHDLGRLLCRFHEEDYRGSLLLGWIFLEEYFTTEWSKFISSRNNIIKGDIKRINKKRRQRLEGLDYTISVIIEQLELANVLSFDEYVLVSELRTIRNNIIHKSYRPTQRDAAKMINRVRKYFEDRVGFELKYHANVYGSTGL